MRCLQNCIPGSSQYTSTELMDFSAMFVKISPTNLHRFCNRLNEFERNLKSLSPYHLSIFLTNVNLSNRMTRIPK